MIDRALKAKTETFLRQFPAVALVGARQTGKTTLAKMLASKAEGRHRRPAVYLDLELPSDQNKLSDPELFLERHRDTLVIIDEVQRAPGLFPVLRALIDKKRRPGRFLLLGSASPELIQKSSESLAGRIGILELGPFSYSEIERKVSLNLHWWRGGYPPALLARNDAESRRWVEAFILTYLERDLPQLGIRVPAPEMRRFWTLLAHNHGQLLNLAELGRSLGHSIPTMKHHQAILENVFQVFLLRPWQTNLKKRLVKSPKSYVCDSGVLHALLGIQSHEALHGHPAIGASFEGYVIQQIRLNLPEGLGIYFYRSQAGTEIDLVFERGGRIVGLVEIKYSSSPVLSKGFHEGRTDLGKPPGWVINPGSESYPLQPGIEVCPLPIFLRKHLPKL